jgi:hypothetical protein
MEKQTIFRIQGNYWLRRNESGGVTLLYFDGRPNQAFPNGKPEPDDQDFQHGGQPVDEGIWASAVCNSSRLGELGDRWHKAISFLRAKWFRVFDAEGQEFPSIEAETEIEALNIANPNPDKTKARFEVKEA